MKKAMKAMKVPELPRVHIVKGVFYPYQGQEEGVGVQAGAWAAALAVGAVHEGGRAVVRRAVGQVGA